MATCTAVYSFFITFPQYWLKLWTHSVEAGDTGHSWFILGYALLVPAAWLTTNAMMWYVFFGELLDHICRN